MVHIVWVGMVEPYYIDWGVDECDGVLRIGLRIVEYGCGVWREVREWKK